MSIAMNLYYTGQDDNAHRFVEEMEKGGTAEAIRREEGNLKYEYFFSASDPHTVLLIDIWKDQKALDDHHASQFMAEIVKLREKYDLHMRAERFVSDGNGIPDTDSSFLRE